MPNWKKLIVSGSDASLNSLNVTNNVTAQSFTGSFSGSFTAPGATTQVVYNNGGVLSADSGFVYSGSNVGIGTSNPTYALEVSGSTGNQGVISSRRLIAYGGTAADPAMATESTIAGLFEAGYAQLGFSSYAGEAGRIETNARRWNIGMTGGTAKFNIRGTGTTSSTTALLVQNANASGSLVVLDDGNVGIGTSNPSTKFVVSNAGASGLEVDPTGGVGSGVLLQAYNRSTSAYMAQSYYALSHTFNVGSGAGTRALDITSAGNVGIGTTSPGAQLQVTVGAAGTVGSIIRGATSQTANLTQWQNSAGTVLASMSSLGALNFTGNAAGTFGYGSIGINGSEFLFMPGTGGINFAKDISGNSGIFMALTTGNVGIGTTTPTTTLEVNGNVKATSFTGSFSGSITHAVSASYALSSSYALTSSYAVSASYAITASHALTASYVNPLNQDLILTGSFIATGGVTASNALINGNLTVIGTASFTYTTASIVNVGASTITLNTDNPAVRFGGINVVDSGSFGTSSTGSLLWDSEKNRWIYSNPSGSTYDGGLLISGPRNTTGLGNEQGTTLNALMKGQGGDHITSSGMFEDSSGNVGVGTASPSAKFEVVGNVKATSFTGSFSGSFTAPGSTTQIVYNDNGVLAANSGLVYSGSNVGIGISAPTEKLHIVSSATGNQFGRITATDSNSSAAWVAQNDSGDNVVYRVFSSGVSGTQMGSALGRSASLLANLGGSGVFLLGTFSNTDFILGTNNTENMRITSAGNVGIGTTTPSSLLNVVAAGTAPAALTVQDNARKVKIGRDQIEVTDLSDTASTMYLQPNSNLVINGTAGNVGIGTQPSQKLEVQGQAQIGNDSVTSAGLFFARRNTNQAKSHYFLSAQESPTYQWIEGGYFTSELTGVSVANNSGKPYYESYAPAGQNKSFGFINQTTSGSSFTSTAATASMTLYQGGNIALAYNGGNVGIGTSSPTAKLEVVGQGSGSVKMGSTGFGGDWVGISLSGNLNTTDYNLLSSATNASFYLNRPTGGDMLFRHNNSDQIIIKSGGNVGIGTTSPGEVLEVVGNIRANVSNGGGFMLTGASASGLVRAGATGLALRTNTTDRLTIDNSGNVGIGTTSPGYKLEVVGAVSASTYYGDGSNLTNIGSGSVSAAGSDGQLQYNNSGLFGGASRLYYNDSTNRVGIGISSPGYDLDVSGSARVQDRLRVGVVNTGNGVIHQSSDATINPTSATVVWSVPGSAGICAFIEYYVFNSNTGTSQRAGNIVTTWNASGTPQITHTETSTPDIGSTSPITFSTGLTLGGDPQLIATNSGGDIWYMIMNYRYF
jgi:hypothetical protein